MAQKSTQARQGASSRPAVEPTEDGLHLVNSILWLDSRKSGQLSFLSTAAICSKPEVPQLITTEETAKILEAKRRQINALICQYNRPFSIGKLKMELLPSGSTLGGASLYLETEKTRILYAPHVQTQKIPTVRQLQLKKAKTLILGAFYPNRLTKQPAPSRKKERERLVKRIKQEINKKRYPIILCEALGIAQEVTQLLSEHEIPVACHRSIYQINRIYENYGSHLGRYTQYSPKYTKQKVLLFPIANPATGLRRLRRPLPEGPVFYIESVDIVGEEPLYGERFFLSQAADTRELKEVIQAVSPQEIYVFGPYAKTYVEDLKTSCKNIYPLYHDNYEPLI